MLNILVYGKSDHSTQTNGSLGKKQLMKKLLERCFTKVYIIFSIIWSYFLLINFLIAKHEKVEKIIFKNHFLMNQIYLKLKLFNKPLKIKKHTHKMKKQLMQEIQGIIIIA